MLAHAPIDNFFFIEPKTMMAILHSGRKAFPKRTAPSVGAQREALDEVIATVGSGRSATSLKNRQAGTVVVAVVFYQHAKPR